MSQNDLHQSLDELRTLWADLPVEHTESKARAGRLIEDINRRVQDLEDDDSRSSVLESLRDLAEHFEAEYPRITETSNRISHLLAGMGI